MPESNLLKSLDYSVLQQCMHCGMCLPTCPTYDATKRELRIEHTVRCIELASRCGRGEDPLALRERHADLATGRRAQPRRVDVEPVRHRAGIDAVLDNPAYKPGARIGRVKLQGIKFTLDGSPQARTAFFTGSW